jgi:hypothetical protein
MVEALMTALRELQQGFAQALIVDDDPEFYARIHGNGLSAARRFAVYRNNVFTSLSEALRACYPVVERLVGEDFFSHAAKQYVRRYPSVSGNLHDYGSDFAGFLAEFPSTSQLAYLADVARLEWLMQETYHAAESPGMDLQALALVTPEQHYALRFRLNPAARLMRSQYPVLRIWRVNQPEFSGDQTVNLNAGESRLLVIRREKAIDLQALGIGEYALLCALNRAEPLLSAVEYAQRYEPDFDLSSILKHLVDDQLITGFYLNELGFNHHERSTKNARYDAYLDG